LPLNVVDTPYRERFREALRTHLRLSHGVTQFEQVPVDRLLREHAALHADDAAADHDHSE
jgi:hypothetical protein